MQPILIIANYSLLHLLLLLLLDDLHFFIEDTLLVLPVAKGFLE